MSLNINIDSFLNSYVQNQTAKLKKSSNTGKNSYGTAVNKSGVDDNIFAVASAVVSDYKSKQDDKSSNGSTSGKSILQLATAQPKRGRPKVFSEFASFQSGWAQIATR